MATNDAPLLSSGGRYTFIGTYVGQYISPRSVRVTADRRLPVAFGKGSRLAQVFNLEIKRSFITGEQLTFTSSAPFQAALQYNSSGAQDTPVKLYKSNGQIVRPDQYFFIKNSLTSKYDKLQIRTEVFDSTATYYIDYQSVDREVLDSVPVNDLRELRLVGDSLNQDKYKEYEDFYIPMEFSSIIGRAANLNNDTLLEAPVAGLSNTGTGSLAQASASSFNHPYTRFYTLTCTSATGTAPSRVATFEWVSTPIQGGNFAYPPSPIHPSAPANTITIQEVNIETLTQALELGVSIDFSFGATHFAAGDTYSFNALGAALFEVDLRHQHQNEIVNYGAVTPGVANTGAGSVSHAGNTNYTGDLCIGISMRCIAASGVSPNRQASFAWTQYRELGSSGIFTVQESIPSTMNVQLTQGIRMQFGFGVSNFAVGDIFSSLIDAPMKFVYFKDDRDYVLSVTSSLSPSLTENHIEGTYSVNTPEGGFGNFQADANTTGSTNGRFQLPDNLILVSRNMLRGGLVQSSRHSVNDKHDFTATLSDVIKWDLTKPATDERDPELSTDILLDVTGTVTGTPNTYYSILSFIPLASLKVIDSVTGLGVTFSHISGTAYIYFNSLPENNLVITYRHKGLEPDPGASYYFSANYLRPDEFYNKLYVVNSLEEGRRLLGPSGTDNFLYIANEISWAQPVPNLTQIGFVQVKDLDQDGVYTVNDYRAALLASESSSLITDRVVLGYFEALPDLLASNLRLSDPLKSKEHLIWLGAPIDTAVGDIDTQDSLVYLARKTLQVFGDSPAHGTRILVSPTWVKKTLTLQDGTTTQVTLDGSFYAWAQACKVAGFSSTSDSILQTLDAGFDDVHVHSEADRLKLGESGIVFPISEGSGVFRVYEDITVDKFAPDFENINAMVQKQDVTRAVRTAMNTSLIGLKIRSGQESIATVSGVLTRILLNLQNQGRIASYQDESGNVRPFDPSSDIRVYRNVDNPTEFQFFYSYHLVYLTKRLFGLYSVDTAKLDLPPSGNASST